MAEKFYLKRDEPFRDDEIGPFGYPWRTDIWENPINGITNGELFATAWGRTETESRSKANSIITALT